jgi:hypothetical protein
MAVAALTVCLLAPVLGAQDAKPQLSGEAAKKSEPGKAVVALITAARAKDQAKGRVTKREGSSSESTGIGHGAMTGRTDAFDLGRLPVRSIVIT